MGPSNRLTHVHDGDISDRQYRLVVLAATLAFVAVVLIWSTITPPFRGVYEHEKFNSILRLEYGGQWREDGGSQISSGVWVAMQEAGFLSELPRSTANWSSEDFADVTPPAEYAVIDASNARARASVDLPDSTAVNPPLYYQIQATAAKVVGVDGADWLTQLQFARWLNVLMAMWIPGLIAAAARHIATKKWAAATVAFVPLAIPELAHACATVNAMPLLVTACLGVTATITLVMHHGPSWRRTIAVGAVLGLAALVSPLAVLLAPLVIAGFVLARPATKWFADTLHALGALVIAAVVAGAWWLTTAAYTAYFTVEKHVAVFGLTGHETDATTHSESIWTFFGETITRTNVSFWGSFGYYEVSFEPALAIALSTMLIAGMALGVVFARKYRVDAIILSSFFLFVFVALLVIFYVRHTSGLEEFGFEGRFMFIALGAVCAVFALGIAKLYALGHVQEGFPMWVPSGALGIALFGLITGFQGFYRPLNETLGGAWTRWTTWTVGGSFTVIVFLLFLAVVAGSPILVNTKILRPDNWEVPNIADRVDQRQWDSRRPSQGDADVDELLRSGDLVLARGPGS